MQVTYVSTEGPGRAPMRRPVDMNVSRVAFEGCAVDMIDRRLTSQRFGGLRLMGLEFALLRIFVGQPRRILSRAELARGLADAGYAGLSPRTVDSYVCRLRRRLNHCGSRAIRTVRQMGYSFEADVTEF